MPADCGARIFGGGTKPRWCFMSNQIAIGIGDFGAIVRMMRSWLPLIVLVALLVFGGSVAFIRQMPPVYSSTALILIQGDPERPLREGAAAASPDADPFSIGGEIAILSSRAVAVMVVERMGLVDHPAFAETPPDAPGDGAAAEQGEAGQGDGALRRVVDAYMERLSVFNDGRSPVISVSVEAPNPELASALANAHVEAYFALKERTAAETYQGMETQVGTALGRSAAALLDIERRIEELRNANGLVLERSGSQGGSLLDERLALLTRHAEEVRSETEDIRSMLRALEDQENPGELAAFEPLRTEAMNVLRQREAVALVDLLRLEARVDEGDPARRQAELDLAAVHRAIEAEVERTRAGLAAELRRTQSELAATEARLDALTAEREAQNLARAEIAALRAEAESRRAFHEALARENETVLFESGFLGADASLISAAVPARAASYPPTKLLTALAAVVALALACGAALVAETTVGRRRDARELAELTGVEAAGEVPLARRDDARAFRVPAVWHAIREVRAAITSGARTDCLVVGVVGAIDDPRVGTVAVGLAKAIAATSAPTLLVDADICEPSVHRVLRMAQAPAGLVDALRGDVEWARSVVNGGQRHFDVLAMGSSGAAVDVDLLSSPRLPVVFEQLRARYSAIVVSAPPATRLADAVAVLSVTDTVALAVPGGRRSAEALLRAHDALARAGAAPRRFVLLSRRPRLLGRRGRAPKGAMGLEQPALAFGRAASG